MATNFEPIYGLSEDEVSLHGLYMCVRLRPRARVFLCLCMFLCARAEVSPRPPRLLLVDIGWGVKRGGGDCVVK